MTEEQMALRFDKLENAIYKLSGELNEAMKKIERDMESKFGELEKRLSAAATNH
jgi:hypothetical protein